MSEQTPPDSTVQAKFVFTRDEYRRAVTSYGTLSSLRILSLFILVLSGFLLLAKYKFFPSLFERVHLPDIGGVIVIITAALGCSVYAIRRMVLNQFEHRPEKNKTIIWTFAPDRVTTEVEELSLVERRWEGFHKVVEKKEGFLIFTSSQVFEWIPYDAFAGEEDLDRFRNMVQDHKVPIR